MKKRFLLFLFIILFMFYINCDTKADTTDYKTFSEVMMASGKLLADYTDAEYEEYYKNLKPTFLGFEVYIENANVDASYISNTLWSVTNSSNTDVTYNVKIETESTNKTTFSSSGSFNLGGSESGGGAKADLSAKCGFDASTISTESVKQTETMSLVVEAGSSAIVYLTGNLTITNGVCASYIFFIEVAKGGFEIATLKNQYARVEKSKLWKRYIH